MTSILYVTGLTGENQCDLFHSMTLNEELKSKHLLVVKRTDVT